jgi:Plant transposon protein
MNSILEEKYPLRVVYTIANEKRTNLSFLADGIIPRWPIFMTSYSIPRTMKENAYIAAQEAERKEVERAFGVLQGKFNIIRESSRFWSREIMLDIVQAVVILHNIFVEYRTEDQSVELKASVPISMSLGSRAQSDMVRVTDGTPPPGTWAAFFQAHRNAKDLNEFKRLRGLLMEHIWLSKGNEHTPA